MLDDTINDSVEEELKAVLEDLGEDQLAEVLAFCWVGQGTYEAADWDEAMEEADGAGRATAPTARSTNCSTCRCSPRCSKPGLAAFELSCDGIGDLS